MWIWHQTIKNKQRNKPKNKNKNKKTHIEKAKRGGIISVKIRVQF